MVLVRWDRILSVGWLRVLLWWCKRNVKYALKINVTICNRWLSKGDCSSICTERLENKVDIWIFDEAFIVK